MFLRIGVEFCGLCSCRFGGDSRKFDVETVGFRNVDDDVETLFRLPGLVGDGGREKVVGGGGGGPASAGGGNRGGERKLPVVVVVMVVGGGGVFSSGVVLS